MNCEICENPLDNQALFWWSYANSAICTPCSNLPPLEYYKARTEAGLPAIYPVSEGCKICNGFDLEDMEEINEICEACKFDLEHARAERGEWRFREP